MHNVLKQKESMRYIIDTIYTYFKSFVEKFYVLKNEGKESMDFILIKVVNHCDTGYTLYGLTYDQRIGMIISTGGWVDIINSSSSSSDSRTLSYFQRLSHHHSVSLSCSILTVFSFLSYILPSFSLTCTCFSFWFRFICLEYYYSSSFFLSAM